MRSNRSRRSDRDLLEDAHALGMLRAVASGLVVRGGEETRSVAAAYLLDGEQVRLSMVGLAREDLILMPISGPPRVAPRGRRLLEGWLRADLSRAFALAELLVWLKTLLTYLTR